MKAPLHLTLFHHSTSDFNTFVRTNSLVELRGGEVERGGDSGLDVCAVVIL